MSRRATILAGIPLSNPAFYHRVRFGVGDPAAWLQLEQDGDRKTEFILRDIEMERARQKVQVDQVSCPADYTPEGGLSGDRATATAQSLAECLKRSEVEVVTADRTLPFIFAWFIQQAGIAIEYCPDLGVLDRRTKDEQELEWLQEAQRVTEEAMLMACQTVARADADSEGVLRHEGAPLTSERLRKMISGFLMDLDYSEPQGSIVASLPHSADCHERGSGPLRTGEAVIVDIFPQNKRTNYCGDCTRTVVHGDASDTMVKMHAAVVAAKEAACAVAKVGATADEVHGATKQAIVEHGFEFLRGQISDEPVMPHGTGHGVGLEIHEPILLDDNGGTLLANEVLTVEPGLYSRKYGGVRVEDIIVITEGEPRNLNKLPLGVDWK
ncbi:MAG: M24 family metallopeptidase [Planctomycetota bacterium]